MKFNSILLLLFFIITINAQTEELTEEDFDKKIAKDSWLLVFHAPWCPHCKQLLPTVSHASYTLRPRNIHVGTVDVTAQKKLRDRYNVKGFPTVFFSKDGVVKPYKGGRSLSAIISYCTRAARDAVSVVNDNNYSLFLRNIQEAGFIFTKSGDTPLVHEQEEIYRSIADDYAVYIDFGFTTDIQLINKISSSKPSFTILSVYSDGTIHNKLSPKNHTREEMLKWIQNNQYSEIPTLEGHNFKSYVTQENKLTAIMCIDPTNVRVNKEMKEFFHKLINSNKLQPKARKLYSFAMMDAVTYESFLDQFNVETDHLPKLIILDSNNNKFYEDPEVDELDEMESFLNAIANGEIKPNSSGWIHKIYRMIVKNYPISLVFIFVGIVLVVLIILIIYEACNEKDEDDEEENSNNTQGLNSIKLKQTENVEQSPIDNNQTSKQGEEGEESGSSGEGESDSEDDGETPKEEENYPVEEDVPDENGKYKTE